MKGLEKMTVIFRILGQKRIQRKTSSVKEKKSRVPFRDLKKFKKTELHSNHIFMSLPMITCEVTVEITPREEWCPSIDLRLLRKNRHESAKR